MGKRVIKNNSKVVQKPRRKLTKQFLAHLAGFAALTSLTILAYPSIIRTNKALSETIDNFKNDYDYKIIIKQKTDDLYQQYRNGEISISDFSKSLEDLDSYNTTTEILRQTQNQETIADLDSKEKASNTATIAGATLGGLAITSAFATLLSTPTKEREDEMEM